MAIPPIRLYVPLRGERRFTPETGKRGKDIGKLVGAKAKVEGASDHASLLSILVRMILDIIAPSFSEVQFFVSPRCHGAVRDHLPCLRFGVLYPPELLSRTCLLQP